MSTTFSYRRPGSSGLRAGAYFFASLASLVLFAGCRSQIEPPSAELASQTEPENEAGLITFDARSQQLAGLKTTAARLDTLPSTIAVNGQIVADPNGIVRLSSVVPGRLTVLKASQGDRVVKGQVLAVLESRSVGEAQSAFRQAAARLKSANATLNVVESQAAAGVFSSAPLEAARKTQTEAQAELASQLTTLAQARVGLENAQKLARAGSYSRPPLEAARQQVSAAQQALKSAEAARDYAQSSVASATAELTRRRAVAQTGGYSSRPVQEAQRALVSAQSARSTAQSEVTTARANLARLNSLLAEGLVAKRDVESAQTTSQSAQSRLDTATAEVQASQAELERQQKLAAAEVTGTAEIQAAQTQLAAAQADLRTRSAELTRAKESLQLARVAQDRETKIAAANIADNREISSAKAAVQQALSGLARARQNLATAKTALTREERIYRLNLNNTAQVQAARGSLTSAQAEFDAAKTALTLLKSSPTGSARLEIRTPIAGVVQERNAVRGESIQADAPIFTVVNLDTVALEAAIYEKDVPLVRPGASITVITDALPNRRFAGRLTFIGTRLDPETRTLPARALIPNSGQLRLGMYARGTLTTGLGTPTVVVPRDAVQTMDDKQVVFVTGPEAFSYMPREVKTGTAARGLIAILDGLKPGEKVVSSGAFVVKSQAMKDELAEEE